MSAAGPLPEMESLIEDFVRTSDVVETSVPRVRLINRSSVDEPIVEQWVPEICMIVSGAKHVDLGAQTLTYGRGDYVVSGLAEPITGTITEAPLMAVSVELDLKRVSEVIFAQHQSESYDGTAFAVATTDPATRDVLLRITRLAVAEHASPYLADLYERELLYLVLQGPLGWVLRRAVQDGGSLRDLTEVLAYLNQFPLQPITTEALADMIGVSTSTLHRRFLEVTGRSPLQYRKQLQLQEAQRYLRSGRPVAEVAKLVGYHSASHFSREYRRLFGAAPSHDGAEVAGTAPQTMIDKRVKRPRRYRGVH